jgi:hypothetical protein
MTHDKTPGRRCAVSRVVEDNSGKNKRRQYWPLIKADETLLKNKAFDDLRQRR